MELDSLKAIWQEVTENQTSQKTLDSQEIRNLLKGKTQSALHKINRNICFETGILLILVLLFSLMMLLDIKNNTWPQKIFFGTFGIISILSGIYYYIKYRQINAILLTTENLKDGLERLIYTIEKYLQIYFYANIVLAPVAFFGGVMAGFNYLNYAQETEKSYEWTFTLSIFLVALLLPFILYPFLRWYIKKLYGNYLDNLRHCLRELAS